MSTPYLPFPTKKFADMPRFPFSQSALVAGWLTLSFLSAVAAEPTPKQVAQEKTYQPIEDRLRPLVQELGQPQPGDWLAQHHEDGQNFGQYRQAAPIRKSAELSTIYVCLIGEFSPAQQKVLDATLHYLEIFYQTPVKVHNRLPLKEIPASAQRVHPKWGMHQIHSIHVLDEVLKPGRPANALAYIAFTANDLFPQPDWNFVFGQANLRERTGVWSIYRFGDPAAGEKEYHLCLKRTLSVAAHETGHILTMQHCIAFPCCMNGSNNLPESDRQPLHFCPVCLRKLCWNLQLNPTEYLSQLEKFNREQKFDDEAQWYAAAREALGRP